jgi:hypothetical protein
MLNLVVRKVTARLYSVNSKFFKESYPIFAAILPHMKSIYVLITLQNAGSLGLSAAVLLSATDCTLGTDTRKCLAVVLVS